MKQLFLLALCLYMAVSSMAQNVIVEGTSPDLYIAHTVVAKENFYSIGRLYNQLPKVIASYNNLAMEKGLSIGQHIKIPLNAQNYDPADKGGDGEALVPMKHTVAKGENIFKVGTQFGVTAQAIRQWNLLSSDNVSQGAALVVGHIKVKPGESSLALRKGVTAPQPSASKPAVTEPSKPVANNTVKEEAIVVAGSTPPPAANKKPEEVPIKVETKAPAPKEEPVKKVVETPKENVAVKEPVKNTEPATKPQETTPPKPEPRRIDLSTTPASAAEGAFAPIFANDNAHKSLTTKSGEAATFKSTSGWQDRKYYVLMNDITPGTILKLRSGESKVVYAKVLGSIPEMKENGGLVLRISNAAASYLGIVDAKFPVEVSYYQ